MQQQRPNGTNHTDHANLLEYIRNCSAVIYIGMLIDDNKTEDLGGWGIFTYRLSDGHCQYYCRMCTCVRKTCRDLFGAANYIDTSEKARWVGKQFEGFVQFRVLFDKKRYVVCRHFAKPADLTIVSCE